MTGRRTAGTPVTPPVRDVARLAGALRRLSAACEEVLEALPAGIADTAVDTNPDTGTDSPPDPGAGIGTDIETVVAALWPATAVSLIRDVEARPGGTYRGRVRWKDPDTGRYRGHSRTFRSERAAWAWVATWTAPPAQAKTKTRGVGK